MKLYLNEITDVATDLVFDETESWVLPAVAKADEVETPQSRPVRVNFAVQKIDEVVVITGHLKTHLRLLCSRCGTPFDFRCSTGFSSLYCKDPEMAGVGYLQRTRDGVEKPAGQNKGVARHAHDFDAEDDSVSGVSSTSNLDITYVSEDFIDLTAVLTEQLQFQVPFQPICAETCKGICTICGADLNSGRCACAKTMKQSAFGALANLKLK
ncbi:MAG: hypothetical protein A2X94_16070 [Bdellovibrionales bacterium GWB1_55_8]|nr:MAG: hypothetical protein A2X94_16070 [Bdellovibrionales bacterium GWB1_55_8]